MLDVLGRTYTILDSVINRGAYASIELSKDKSCDNHKIITRIVYGVLDKYIKLDYMLNQLVDRRPKPKIRLIIIIGLYCLNNMQSMPDYAVVDNLVDLTKKIGKREMSGFVNAVLKNSIGYKYNFPKDKTHNLSVIYSKPQFLVKYYINRYGLEKAEKIISVMPYELEHIRYNSLNTTREEFEETLKKLNVEYIISASQGYYIRNSDAIYGLFNQGIITYQSMTSMQVVKAMAVKDNSDVLDLCAAPGGKSVYIAELSNASKVVACDIHPHRVDLINKYVDRMGINNIVTMVNDATCLNDDFIDKFDYVLCDVPCSGFGLINKKPDIMLNFKQSDIESLTEIQYNILYNATKYVKSGGIIIYSTCTTIYDENEGVIKRLLQNVKGIELEPIRDGQSMVNYLPDNNGQDGYFIARIKKL